MPDSGSGGAVSPFPMGDPKDIKELMNKIQQQMDELYQNRVGGAMLGDVFGVGNDEVLTLVLATNGGLTKVGNSLSVILKSGYCLALDASGIYLLIKADSGLDKDANGLFVKLNPTGGLTVDSTGLSLATSAALAWTVFTPVITASAGTFTVVAGTGYWIEIGKTVYFQETITITTNGSASGQVVSTLPTDAIRAGWVAMGLESSVTGKACVGFGEQASMIITFYDGTYPGGSGYTINISGMYEGV